MNLKIEGVTMLIKCTKKLLNQLKIKPVFDNQNDILTFNGED